MKVQETSLKECCAWQSVEKISSSAYTLDLPEHMGIINICNISDLTLCSNKNNVTTNGDLDACLWATPPPNKDIEEVIDRQIVSTRGGVIRCILSNGEASHFQISHGSQIGSSWSWIKMSSERFHSFNLPMVKIFKLGGVDGHKWLPPLKVYHKRKEVGSEVQSLIWYSLDDEGTSWDLI